MILKYTIFTFSLILTACATSSKIAKTMKMEDFYFVQKSNKINQSWVIVLPGTEGLSVFGDTTHYFSVARKLNEKGFSVILVDYKEAYKSSHRNTKETTGEKIEWVLGNVIDWGTKNCFSDSTKINILGWSLAGEGLSLLANDSIKMNQLNIKSIALYYPSNQNKVKVKTSIPIFIFSGKADMTTPWKDIQDTYLNNVSVHIESYENAYHGFDIEQLKEEKTMRLPPLIGKKHIFKYNEQAAKSSFIQLINFFQKNK